MTSSSWTRHFTAPVGLKAAQSPFSGNNQTPSDMSNANFVSFLPEVYSGAPDRISRYTQYESMDNDPIINSALNTISEFSTQENEYTKLPFIIEFSSTDATDQEKDTLDEALKKWCYLNDFKTRLFHIFRKVLVYGDCFFVRDPETYEWYFVDPKNVEKCVVDELKGKEPESYFIRDLDLNVTAKVMSIAKQGTQNYMLAGMPTSTGATNYPGQNNWSQPSNNSRFTNSSNTTEIPGKHVIHLSLNTGLDSFWPFGNSILEPVFKVHKQKDLLEESMVIYRVQRAPERRVFKVYTGTLPTQKAMAFVERVKNELQQRRIPSRNGQGQCFSLDTKIPLLDGRTLELREIISEQENGKQNWIYSCDPNSGKMVPGKITWAGITRKDTQVVKLTLDSGENIICTPDHKFPILGKGKVEAKDIKVDEDSLISFNTRLYNIKGKETSKNTTMPKYLQVFDHSDKTWKFVHKTVAKFFKEQNLHEELIYGNIEIEKHKLSTIHHKDFNKFNNTPNNLAFMNNHNHFVLHSSESKKMWESFSEEKKMELSKKSSENLKKYWEYVYNTPDKLAEMKEIWLKQGKLNYENKSDELKLALLNNLTEMHKPWRNQAIICNENMFNILVNMTKNSNDAKHEILEKLSNDKEFMNEYLNLNKKVEGLTCKLKFDVFCNTALYTLLEKNGYDSWKDFTTKIRGKWKRKGKKLNWTQQHLSVLVTVTKHSKHLYMSEVMQALTNDKEFMLSVKNANTDNGVVNNNGNYNKFTLEKLMSLIKNFGYENWNDFINKLSLYNHKIVKIEWLDSKIDTGTITVDGNEELHNFHTFALSSGVYTFNSIMDSSYNPLSILEDYYFPIDAEGHGPSVELLPGGSELGTINDLLYFNNQLARGLGVPSSYLPSGPEDGQTGYNDGKAGVSYIQEFRFSKFCKRIQNILIGYFDYEFKLFLKRSGVVIESSQFTLNLEEPESFSDYKAIEKDQAIFGNLTQALSLPVFSRRFALKKYGLLSETEIVENEKLWREENKGKLKGPAKTMDQGDSDISLRHVGITPPTPSFGNEAEPENIEEPINNTEGGGFEAAEAGGPTSTAPVVGTSANPTGT